MLGTAIEYYDIWKDPIKYYFQDKISFLLSRKQILSEIMNTNQQSELQNSILMYTD